MHVLFDPQGRPFLLGSQMRWELEPNAFLARLSIISGRTSSPRTWRSYAYQLADWLSFCERLALSGGASRAEHRDYRNILGSESSPQTGRPLKRTTIDHKLSVICGFYLFVQKKGWIDALPFELEATHREADVNINTVVRKLPGGSLGVRNRPQVSPVLNGNWRSKTAASSSLSSNWPA